MAIQSLGVGSGLDLEALVSQLLEAERTPKTQRLDTREAEVESTISGFGKLKSKMSEFEDVLDELKEADNTHTARFLNGSKEVAVPKSRRKWKNGISIKGAKENNLNIKEVKIPLEVLTVITGVSGSGKSTLIGIFEDLSSGHS